MHTIVMYGKQTQLLFVVTVQLEHASFIGVDNGLRQQTKTL